MPSHAILDMGASKIGVRTHVSPSVYQHAHAHVCTHVNTQAAADKAAAAHWLQKAKAESAQFKG